MTEQSTLMPRLMATFRPQRWVNDYAVDLDDPVEFDATVAFLTWSDAVIRSFRPNDYRTDALADDLPARQVHDGPFEVDVDPDAWLEDQGYPPCARLTAAHLQALRDHFAVEAMSRRTAEPPPQRTYELTLDPGIRIEVRVPPVGGAVLSSNLGEVLGSGVRARAMTDALESLLTAHAAAGVDLDEPAYLAGLTVALEAIFNHLE